MLEGGRRLPVLDRVCPGDTLDTVTDFGLCTITDNIIHLSPFSYLVIQGVDEFGVSAAASCNARHVS